MKIVEYKPSHIKSVLAFNDRLKKNAIKYKFPENYKSKLFPNYSGNIVYEEMYLIIDEKEHVRGGYKLKFQKFYFKGSYLNMGFFHLPLSEGLINKKYNAVSLMIYRHAIKREKHIFVLGIGGMDEKLAIMLKSFGWGLRLVPFYFRIINLKNFINNIKYLNKNKFIMFIIKICFYSGISKLLLKIYNIIMDRNIISDKRYDTVEYFDTWADKIWNEAKNQYSFISVRDSETLNMIYPKTNKKFIRIKVFYRSEIVGWCVLLKTKLLNHKQFGNMFLGSIVDCLSLKGHEDLIIKCAIEYLTNHKVDLIVTNQSSIIWCKSLRSSAFINGPSNFVFGIPKTLLDNFNNYYESFKKFHFNRGDGDGPINL